MILNCPSWLFWWYQTFGALSSGSFLLNGSIWCDFNVHLPYFAFKLIKMSLIATWIKKLQKTKKFNRQFIFVSQFSLRPLILEILLIKKEVLNLKNYQLSDWSWISRIKPNEKVVFIRKALILRNYPNFPIVF